MARKAARTKKPKTRRIVPIFGSVVLPGDGKPVEGKTYTILATVPKGKVEAAA